MMVSRLAPKRVLGASCMCDVVGWLKRRVKLAGCFNGNQAGVDAATEAL